MYVGPSYINVLAAVMRERGHDPALIGARYERPLGEAELFDLCTRIVAGTPDDPALPLHVGAAMHLGVHGLFGHALMSCRTLKQAAGILMRHNPLKSDSSLSELTFEKARRSLPSSRPSRCRGARIS